MSSESSDTQPEPDRLTVLVNGTEVGRFAVRERVSVDCPVPWALIERSASLSITFQHREDSPAGALAFATLSFFRAGEPDPSNHAEPIGVPAGVAAAVAPAPAALPAVSEGRQGYVDLYGYSELVGGWLLVGWVLLDGGPDRAPATAERSLARILARFDDGEAAGDHDVAFYRRDDLPEGGLGFVVRLRAARGRHETLAGLQLDFAGASLRLPPSRLASVMAAGEANAWIARAVGDTGTDAAVKSLLLRSVIGEAIDAGYYMTRYPDVRRSGASPAAHYADAGWRENRDPTPWFCTRDYLELYPEVRAAGLNPFFHYLLHGKGEGRRTHDRSAEWETIAAEFDIGWYLSRYPEIAERRREPVQHYIDGGWREGRDPAPWFSTTYYLERYPDVRQSGANPFHHYLQSGRTEGRMPAGYAVRVRARQYRPSVSVIVPNYNHADFLAERLDSILQQSYEVGEIVVLDDASADASRDVIEQYRHRHPDKIRTLYNHDNSGSVFHQWRRGLEQVGGDLVWICESDDSCERDFLDRLVPHFADPSVMLAFGRIQCVDVRDAEWDWLDIYRESAAPGIWDEVKIAPAYEWFRGGFAVRNVIPNVGGCIFRRQVLPDPVWDEAVKYRVLGDWFLYAHLAGGGRIGYDPHAVSYFRQHAANTSVGSLGGEQYYIEHLWLGRMLRQRFGTPDDAVFRFYRILSDQYAERFGEERRHELRHLVDLDDILRTPRTQRHILVAVYGFQTGGAEVFAIQLANQFAELGHTVSVLCTLDNETNPGVRAMLDPRIAVYERALVDELGVEAFVASAGIDVVNSHFIAAEYLFLAKSGGGARLPYVVTLHGAYEMHNVSDSDLLAFVRGVDYWVHTARKNLGHLKDIPIAPERTIALPNALKLDEGRFAYARQDVGADADTVIFGIASRAVPEKCWEESIEALHLAQQQTGRRLMLLFCGDGPELERLQALHGDSANVRFLGFQPNIHGFYRLCDSAVLLTRYGGESFPLSLVQALQVGTPAIATDVAEIRAMLEADGRSAGIVVPASGRRDALIRALARAMLEISDDAFRAARREDAAELGHRYDLASLARRYLEIFAKAANW